MNQNLLILGGSGFFGKSILEFLYQKKFFYKKKFNTITILSRQYRGNNIIVNKLKEYFKVIYIKKDFFKMDKLPEAQFIIYCLLLDSAKKNYQAVKHFVRIAKKLRTKSSIAFTSSGAVYGNKLNKKKRVMENLSLNNKFNFLTLEKNKYAISKLKSEKFLERLSKKGFKIIILRCFAFVGKDLPSNKGFAVKDFIDRVISLKEVTVNSRHKVLRSYMHQNDLANWVLTILLNNIKLFSIYNVGSDEPISIHNLAHSLSKKFSLKFESNYCKSNYIDSYIPNIAKAKNDFKLKLCFNNLEAIYKTIKDLKKNKHIYKPYKKKQESKFYGE